MTRSKLSTSAVSQCRNTIVHSFIRSFLKDQRQSPKQPHDEACDVIHERDAVHDRDPAAARRVEARLFCIDQAAYAAYRCVQSTGFQRHCSIVLAVSANALLKLLIHVHISVAQLKY